MSVRKISLFDNRFRMSDKESSDHIIYRNMALFISCCWFYLTSCVFFLIKFIAGHIFRFKMVDSSQKALKDYSEPLEPVSIANEIEERGRFNGFSEEEEEETSSFSFKFEYQIPKASTVSNEEPSVSITEENYLQAKTTNVSNYRFLSEKDFSGFVEEPEIITFRVHESFGVGGEEKIKSKSMSERYFNGVVEEKEAVPSQIHQSVVISNGERLELKFLSEKDFPEFIEEPEAVPVQVHESFADGSEEESESEFLSERDIRRFVEEPEPLPNIRVRESFVDSNEERLEYKFLSEGYFERPSMQSPDIVFSKYQKSEGKRPFGIIELNSLGEKEVSFSGFDSDSDDSMSISDGYSVKNLVVDSGSDGFLSENDFGDKESLIGSSTFGMELVEDMEKIEEGQSTNSNAEFSEFKNLTGSENVCYGFNEPEKISGEKIQKLQNVSAEKTPYTDMMSQLDETWSENGSLKPEVEMRELNVGELDETQLSRSSAQIEYLDSSDDDLRFYRNDRSNVDDSELAESELMHENLDSEAETNGHNGNHHNAINDSKQVDEVNGRDTEKSIAEEKHEETQLNNLDDEGLEELESLWEHQDLIEQLKMELKRVRAIGLPTIFEESESSKTIEDLKPWRFDEKFLREDPMDELHKFYKSYRERMRKFDILNYQKMYAIGFLQLKDPLEMIGTHKPLIPAIINHLSQNLKPLYRQKSSTDPSEKFMKELQVDLETVYVGQTCLSWEFLRWQYEKARELPDSDPYRSHQYNHVAGEFQQFQVIVQRFVENESFQGPRLQNYVKNRCVLRNLLQVPVIKEDCLKDKMEERRKGNYGITSEMLEDIMEETIRVFWEFVKADKDESSSIILKGLMRSQVELQDPLDFTLMSEIQATLQKKDKKLKDIQKTGNCLVKKFKKPREDRSNQDLFFSQVDMKLISRVLKMSRITTDQLLWCHKKLSKITFADRKIHREPSFLLFPC